MTPTKAILIGAAEAASVKPLMDALQRSGLRVERVSAGPQVIERALFERYDAVLLDASIALLPPRHVRDLLRTNPRTRSLLVYLVDCAGAVQGDAEFIQSPERDLAWLKVLLPKGSQGEDGRVAVDLREIQLPDVLQMLLQNQRIGVAEVESHGRVGTIEIGADGFGRIQLGEHQGLKALARILSWHVGSFRFVPKPNIVAQASGNALGLLLDAVRLADEAEHLRQTLPHGSRLVFQAKSDEQAPHGPLLEQVLLLVDFYGGVDDILERIPVPDAEVLAAIAELHKLQWVQVRLPSGTGDGAAWPDLALRDALTANNSPAIVWLVGNDADYVRILWNDARLQARLDNRKSLRNAGRFGGNGWIVDAGKNREVWLRFLPPAPIFPDFALRSDLNGAGVVIVADAQDEAELPSLRKLAAAADLAGLRVAWLAPEDMAATNSADAIGFWQAPSEDAPNAFWQALGGVLGEGSVA